MTTMRRIKKLEELEEKEIEDLISLEEITKVIGSIETLDEIMLIMVDRWIHNKDFGEYSNISIIDMIIENLNGGGGWISTDDNINIDIWSNVLDNDSFVFYLNKYFKKNNYPLRVYFPYSFCVVGLNQIINDESVPNKIRDKVKNILKDSDERWDILGYYSNNKKNWVSLGEDLIMIENTRPLSCALHGIKFKTESDLKEHQDCISPISKTHMKESSNNIFIETNSESEVEKEKRINEIRKWLDGQK